MNCSFTPDGDWFVLDEQTGATIQRRFRSKRAAVVWIVNQYRKRHA